MSKILKSTVIVAIIIICIVAVGLVYTGYKVSQSATSYCQEYVAGAEGMMGEVNVSYFEEKSEHYQIGANSGGYAVFKTPYKAFREMKTTNRAGIRVIRMENHLFYPLTPITYQMFAKYGWQVTSGSEKAQEQARFVSQFLDLYENGGIPSLP